MNAADKFFFLLLFSLLLSFNSMSQITIDIQYYDNRNIPDELFGFHMSNFFEQCVCYDPVSPGPPVDSIEQCMSYAADLKPRVVR